MKFLFTFLSLCVLASIVSSFPQGFYSHFTGDFGGPSAFSESFAPATASNRDNRQNRGPVVFPVVENPIVESSGVVIGASGFGFVPPGSSSLSFLQRIMMME